MQVSEEKNLEQQIIASLLISPRKIEIAEEYKKGRSIRIRIETIF